MAAKKRTRGNPVPLMREDHPKDYAGYPFITLLQYQQEAILTIVDNSDDKKIHAYVLDLCGSESVNEETIIHTADVWFEASADKHPLSFEFSRLGMASEVSQIHRTFNTDFITRVIGPLPRFNMNVAPTIKRRRRKPVPAGVEVQINSTTLFPSSN